MEQPNFVKVADNLVLVCMVFATLTFLFFFTFGFSSYTIVVFGCCFASAILGLCIVAALSYCDNRVELSDIVAQRAAAMAAAHAAVIHIDQPSLTAGVMNDEAQAASSAPNNTNTSNPISTSDAGNNNAVDTGDATNDNASDSNAADTANVSYGLGDSPPAVRLTLVIEGNDHVRLAPMPVDQASALRPVNERAGVAGAESGEHVAGVPLASYSMQVQIHNSNNNDGNASHGGGAGRGGGEEGAQYAGHDREGTCEAAAGEGGNEMSDDALYGRGAYIPCTTADVNAAASAATEVVMVPVEQTAQEMQPSSSQAAAAAAEDHEEEEDVAKKPAAEANAEV